MLWAMELSVITVIILASGSVSMGEDLEVVADAKSQSVKEIGISVLNITGNVCGNLQNFVLDFGGW